MADERQIIALWIVGTLSADATLASLSTGITSRIYDTEASQLETTYPIIIFEHRSGVYRHYNGSLRLLLDAEYCIKVIGSNHSYDQLATIYDRINTLLDEGSGLPTGGRIVACLATRPIKYPEPAAPGGVIHRHFGSFYQIQAHKV